MRKTLVKLYYILGGKKGSLLQRVWSTLCLMHSRRIGQKKLQKYGITVLQLFHEACETTKKKGWLEFGTLLGAYRELSFIAHDFDLDVGMMADEYNQVFENKMQELGFVKKHCFYLINETAHKKVLTEITYTYHGFALDIFLSFPHKDKRQNYVYIVQDDDTFQVNTYVLDYINKLVKVTINGYEFNAPEHPELFLETVYGPCFMTPDPSWTTASNRNKRVTRLDFACYRGEKEEFV